MRYAKPATLEEAVALLAEGDWRLLAGGTDVYPAHVDRPLPSKVLDLNGIAGLRGIVEDGCHWRLGARTTWSDIVAAALPPAFDALKLAAREIGSIQIQNAGTIGGNLCNASPAADGVPALMILDPEVVLRSRAGERSLPLAAFVLGNRVTARREDEIVTGIRIPKASAKGRSSFLKLGARKYLVISIAMVAARLAVDASGRVGDAAVAVGSCSEVAVRLGRLEVALLGRRADRDLAGVAAPEHMIPLQPISDVRASADYRRSAALELVRRALGRCLGPALEAA